MEVINRSKRYIAHVSRIFPGQLRRFDFRVFSRDPDIESFLLILSPDENYKERTFVLHDGIIKSLSNDIIESATHPVLREE